MMAAGLVVAAHNSGGPRLDIVTSHGGPTGYLASTRDEYAAVLAEIGKASHASLAAPLTDCGCIVLFALL